MISSVFLKGLTRFRRSELAKTATRELTDVISKNPVNANASTMGTVKVSMGKNFRFGSRTEAVAA